MFSETKTEKDVGQGTVESPRSFDEQRPLFQLFGGWIVTATRSGLVLVDQHRAHTRILYERFSTSTTQQGQGAQQLLFPSDLDLGPADVLLLRDSSQSLTDLGFDLEFPEDGRSGFWDCRRLQPKGSQLCSSTPFLKSSESAVKWMQICGPVEQRRVLRGPQPFPQVEH